MIAAVKSDLRRTPSPQPFRASSRDVPGPLDAADKAGFILLLGTVGLAPLVGVASLHLVPLGPVSLPVSELGRTLLQVLAFLAAALAFFSRAPARSAKTLRVPLIAFATFTAFGVLQLIPLPDGFLRFVAPVNRAIYHDAAEILGLFRAPSPLPRISIVPSETVRVVGSLIACAVLFLASTNLIVDRKRLRTFAAVIVLSTLVRIVIAMIAPASADTRATGAHAEIALALCFGVVWAETLTGGRRVRRDADRAERLEQRVLPLAVRLAVWTAIALGIAWTAPSSATSATVATTVALVVVGNLHRRARSRRRTAIAVAAVLVALAFATAGTSFLFRRVPHSLAPSSSEAHGLVEAWRLFPIVGSGLGTLRDAVRRVQPPGSGGGPDALQILVTGGVIGATLAAASFLFLVVSLFAAWRGQRHRQESAFVLAAMGALFSLALCGATGPALADSTVALSLAAVTGAGWASGGGASV